jgi:tryptophan synthase beta subunit
MPLTKPYATGVVIRRYVYIIGSTVGPHPYPDMVARLQSIISEKIKKQLLEKEGRDILIT